MTSNHESSFTKKLQHKHFQIYSVNNHLSKFKCLNFTTKIFQKKQTKYKLVSTKRKITILQSKKKQIIVSIVLNFILEQIYFSPNHILWTSLKQDRCYAINLTQYIINICTLSLFFEVNFTKLTLIFCTYFFPFSQEFIYIFLNIITVLQTLQYEAINKQILGYFNQNNRLFIKDCIKQQQIQILHYIYIL
ncbi:hypothetical protein ABPG74_018464 [Tetrahymena malaccensis]